MDSSNNFNWEKDTWTVLDSYFSDKRKLVAHQIDTYNHFVENKLQEIINEFNPIVSYMDFNVELGKYMTEYHVIFGDIYISKPVIDDGKMKKPMYPNAARLRNLTYSGVLSCDVYQKIIRYDPKTLKVDEVELPTLKQLNIGKLPIMLQSKYCILSEQTNKTRSEMGEGEYDDGGYFIVNGSEKVIVCFEKKCENKIYVFPQSKGPSTTYSHIAEITSIHLDKPGYPKLIQVKLTSKEGNYFGRTIRVQISRVRTEIPIGVVFRALGIISDKDIIQTIVYDLESEIAKELIDLLRPSLEESAQIQTKKIALEYISKYVSNISSKTIVSNKYKLKYTEDILMSELLPHVGSNSTKKAYFLGLMINKLLLNFKGKLKPDDRDSFINKRVESPGVLLASLFRANFNKLVKDMKASIDKDIKNGRFDEISAGLSKKIKANTIETSLKYALATGSWGVKSQVSKKGVAQVLNRLSYASALSHKRRVIAPIERNGKQTLPRKLHNTQFSVCCACVAGDTEILLNDGLSIKNIRDFGNDNKNGVMTVNPDDLRETASDVYNFFGIMPEKLFEVTTISGRKIKCTGDHPFLIYDKNEFIWIHAEDLQEGDKVVIRYCEKSLKHESGELRKSILARLFGYIMAITKSIDTKARDDISNDMEILGLKSIDALIGSITMIPDWIMNASKFVKREWLAGFAGRYCREQNTYILMDGIKKSIKKESTDDLIKFFRQIHRLYGEFCIDTLVCIKNNDDCDEISLTFSNEKFNYYKYLKYIGYRYNELKRNESVLTYETLKYDIYQEKNGSKIGKNTFHNIISLSHGKVAVEIESIKEIEPEEVYDFTTVSTNSSFIANGFVTHNCETPEGSSIGIVKNLAMLASITIDSNPMTIIECLGELGVVPLEEVAQNEIARYVKVFVNGDWLGIHKNPNEFIGTLRNMRRKAIINIYTSISWHIKFSEIHINTDAGRLCRPLYIVEDNNLLINDAIIKKLRNKEIIWEDILADVNKEMGVIEYIDVEEEDTRMIAMTYENLRKNKRENEAFYKYSPCEIHPSMMLGVLASNIPFPDHNQAPRNLFQAAMGKQAMGVYATNFMRRMDTIGHILYYPQKPLVNTRASKYVNSDVLPSGQNAIVAIACYTGYNQEDSLIMNKSAIERGLFISSSFRTHKDEEKKNQSTLEEEKFCKPVKYNPNGTLKTRAMKSGSYDKLDDRGFVKEGSKVEEGDVIIGKVIPLKVTSPTEPKFKDASTTMRHNESGIVDWVYSDKNADGYEFCKVRVRSERVPEIGDKFACYTKYHHVLTTEGWVPIAEITKEHKVASLVDGKRLVYVNPEETMEYDCDEEMYKVDTNQVSLLVTKNHRMWMSTRQSNKYVIKKAEECYGKRWKFMKDCDEWIPDFSEGCPKELKLNEENTKATHFLIYDDDDEIAHEL